MDIAQYLEAAKTEEVAEQLRSEGYQVILDQVESGHDNGYDIIATKDGKRVAIEVKARSHLRESARLIRELREQAVHQGYDEFRLVIVNPPRERSIEINNFENILYEYMIGNSFPELEDLAGGTAIEEVSDVEIDAIEISSNGINVQGTGVVSVSLEYGRNETDDGLSIDYDFPLVFTVDINHEIHIDHGQINIDTSSFFE